MDFIKNLQSILPVLTGLPFPQKLIASALIIGAVTLLLVVIWTPQPDKAVTTILKDCYKRALFTRMHAQINVDAMFASIEKCRETIQNQIPEIGDKALQSDATELLAAVEGIERLKNNPQSDPINKLKLAALHFFRKLAIANGGSYPLPQSDKLGEAVYFDEKEAEAPLDYSDLKVQLSIDPATGKTLFP
jgi:hypothetical protein